MSLLLRHEHILGLSADTVSLLTCRRAAWSRMPVITDKRVQPSAPGELHAPWQQALASAHQMLTGAPHGRGLRVVLSNQLVRYKVLPAMPVLMAQAEKNMVAQQCFRDTHGEQVLQWTVVINPLPHAGSVLVCAMDTALLQGLHALAEASQSRLLSVQPYLMTGFNLARKNLHADHSCFVQMEVGRATLAFIEHGQWRNVATAILRDQPEIGLIAALQRELLLAEMPAARLQIVMQAEQSLVPFSQPHFAELASTRGWRVQQVLSQLPQGYQPHSDHVYAMAVTGALRCV